MEDIEYFNKINKHQHQVKERKEDHNKSIWSNDDSNGRISYAEEVGEKERNQDQIPRKSNPSFSSKVTQLGENICLLEEGDPREIEDLISEAKDWWMQWFYEIRK